MHAENTSSTSSNYNNIKSISQIHYQMIQKRKIISKQFQQLSIPSLPSNLDFQSQNITFDKIFSEIPSQQKLKDILDKISHKQDLNLKLKNYNGPYQLVKKAAQKVQTIKPEAKQIYCLFSQLNLPKIKENFKIAKQNNSIKLSSFQLSTMDNSSMKQQKNQQSEKLIQKSNEIEHYKPKSNLLLNQSFSSTSKPQQIKATKFQRNTISQQYIYSIKESTRYQQILPSNQYLKQDDLLIHICIYQSLNGQKQHQFIFLGEMKLIDVKKEIYCKFQFLQKQYDKINNTNCGGYKKQTERNNQDKSFFLIQQNLYYQGTHHSQYQIDSLIKSIKVNYQTDLHKFSMNHTQLKNLRVVFGRPYLFRHMNGCDHMIVFKDIRLFDKNGIDPDIKIKYPFMVFESKMKKKKCQGCQESFANFVCIGDMLKNGQISYLCKQCHLNIHNDLTNPKNKFMKILPYIHE